MFYFIPILSLLLLGLAHAKTVELNWNIGWVTRSPDGFSRRVIAINNQWPLPALEVKQGDRVLIHVKNNLGDSTTSIHWHGLRQDGSMTMDGPAGVVQCPIPPGGKFTYDFNTGDSIGTYWYHAHVDGQYMDGLRAPLIIHDKKGPYHKEYKHDVNLMLSDWYHTEAPDLLASYLVPGEGGAEPVPDAALINDAQNLKIKVKKNTVYRFRLINVSGFGGFLVKFAEHDLTVIEMDGVYTEKKVMSEIYLLPGQRYSVLLSTKSSAGKNFAFSAQPFSAKLDQDQFAYPSPRPQVNGSLEYDPSYSTPTGLTLPDHITDTTRDWDNDLVPLDRMPLLPKPDRIIPFDITFTSDSRNVNLGHFNNVSYVFQKVPALYTALSAPDQYVENPAIYSKYINPVVLKAGEVVDFHVKNYDTGSHPMHLHGQVYQMIYRGPSGSGYDYDPSKFAAIPPRHDTALVNVGASLILRFQVVNPGVYIFHCHIDWHVSAGLTATIIQDPLGLKRSGLKIPQDHLDVCKVMKQPTVGNAAGNTKNWLDLTGEVSVKPLPDHGARYTPARRYMRAR